ncbi:Protein N-lysine methyltransferase METTL21A [Balamuthia mandrillaris]
MSGPDFLALLARLAWKREGRSHKARFEDDYVYKFQPSTLEVMKGTPPKLTIHQSPASLGTTVWDSSIVLGKYFEKQAVFPPKYFQSKSVIELGCGCGLTGLILHCLDTIDVVRRNVKDNSTAPESDIQVFVQSWGEELPTNEKFDVIVGTDIMYIPEAIPALITSLEQLATPNADIYFAYGRNRNGEDEFKKGIAGTFTLEEVKREDLDELYQSDEITQQLQHK